MKDTIVSPNIIPCQKSVSLYYVFEDLELSSIIESTDLLIDSSSKKTMPRFMMTKEKYNNYFK